MSNVVIETRKLTKVFGDLTACDGIDIKIELGKIHAIAGENGAGKSTLMKMLYGVYPKTRGDILVDGKEMNVWNPAIAREKGMGMVFQDFRLIPAFTVLENVFLADVRSGGILSKRRMRRQISELSDRYHLQVHPDSNVWKLDLGQRQHVEILKVLMGKNTRILIFDEPTSVLAPHEIQAFLEMLVQLKRDNYAVLLITHKIKEIIAVADLITVLRQGKQVQTFTREEGYSEQKIVASMLNSEDTDLNLEYRRYEQLKDKPEGGEVFRASHLTVKDNHNRNIIDDAQFGLRRGEILGVAGISGNGQKELAEAIAGMRKVSGGQIWMKGQEIKKATVRERLQMGIRSVTEDPMRDHVIRSFTVLEHMALAGMKVHTKGVNIDWNRLEKEYGKYEIVKNMKVPKAHRFAAQLSGGNLQRMVFARAMVSSPDFLLASYPSRGLDVATVKSVHNALLELRQNKASVLLVSEDVSELFAISDRVIVLANHRIYGPYDPEQVTQEQIGKIMLKGDD